jgi:hypothetical protein
MSMFTKFTFMISLLLACSSNAFAFYVVPPACDSNLKSYGRLTYHGGAGRYNMKQFRIIERNVLANGALDVQFCKVQNSNDIGVIIIWSNGRSTIDVYNAPFALYE